MITTLKDIKLFNFEKFEEKNGILIPITSLESFEIKRVYYVFNVNSYDIRGQHAHKKGEQVLIALNGILSCQVDDGCERKQYILDSPEKGLYIPPMIWDEQIYISSNTIMVALANNIYDPNDYITDYKEFKQLKENEK